MKPKRSTLTMRQFVKELRQTWSSKFQDYHILLWNTHKVPAFENWFRKLRTTQIDMFLNNIYDRFIRDEKFRNRMIENGRDEDACRQMDALADEDHTHHLTPQEYYYYKSNWWLRSNKTGSNTVPVEHRPDFKQALSTLQQLKQKEEEARRNQWAQSSSSSWWSWQGSWWTPYSYESHHGDEPSTDWTNRLVIQVFGTSLQGMIFLNSLILLQMYRLQLTAVYCNRRGV